MLSMVSHPAKKEQEEKFIERRTAPRIIVTVCGEKFVADKNVYDTGVDTELMVDSVTVNPRETFVEIGSGMGAVSLLLGKRAKSGLGVDKNKAAVKNSIINKKRHKVDNVEFSISDVFENVDGKFDVIICNPPYSPYKPSDEMEMMFWDNQNSMKKKFFSQVRNHLKSDGAVYFGWADFADIDQSLPDRLAQKVGLKRTKRFSRKNKKGDRIFYVYKFVIQ